MAGMQIYEDARTVSRADLAAWLRQLASQLESGGQIFYGAAGAVAVADQVRCELEIEREGGREISVEIEFSWASPEAAGSAGRSGEAETEKDEDVNEEGEEAGDAEKAGKVTPAAVAADGDITAAKSASVAEDAADSDTRPTEAA